MKIIVVGDLILTLLLYPRSLKVCPGTAERAIKTGILQQDTFTDLRLKKENIRWGLSMSEVPVGWFTGARWGFDGLERGEKLLISSPDNRHDFTETEFDVTGVPLNFGVIFKRM